MKEENRFAPPDAAVADVLRLHDDMTGLDYEVRKLDYFLFVLIHSFCIIPLQFVYIGFCILAATMVRDSGGFAAFLVGAFLYIGQWAVQAVFVAMVAMSKNKRLYTRHEIKSTDEAFVVFTSYARLYYNWKGLEKILATPWFVAVYINKQAAHVIPNRAFRNSEARRDFVKLVETMRGA